MSTTTSSRRPGWWYPYIFVGVFLVVLAVNVIMAYSAVNTFSGIQTENAYEKGVAYNQELAQAKAQERLGWKVEATMVPHDPSNTERHDADLLVTYLDKSDHPVVGLSVKAEVLRPTKAGNDLSVELVERGAGQYTSLVPLPLAGQWELTVTATLGDVKHQLNQRVLVP